MNEMAKDYVCQMQVSSASFATEYAGSHYAFCSAQCRDRFLATPHLYIGFPGSKAPAQKGEIVIKRHRFTMEPPLDAMQAEQVKRGLMEMMGVQEVIIGDGKIEIRYDLMKATITQLADKLASIGADLGGGWANRLKLVFISTMEEIENNSREVNNKKKSCH